MTGMVLFIMILLLASGIGFLSFILIKSLLAPQKAQQLISFVKQGKYQNAIKTAKALIAREPRNIEAHYYLGQAFQADGKGELALMEYKIVNQIGTFNSLVPEVEFRKRIAGLFVRFNQPEEALKEYVLLTKLEPAAAENYYWADKLFSDRNRSETAIGYLRKAVELDPKLGRAHFELGLLLFREKKPLESKAELEQALRLEPDKVEAYYYLGKLQKESHDYVAALLSFEKAERDPEVKVKALVERGGCYMSMNSFEKAIPELERAVKISTDESSTETLYARYFLAMCYEKNRDLDRAVEQWERIYQKKPGFRDVAEKLSHYQEFRADDKMKDFLTSSREDFIEFCKALVTNGMLLQIRDFKELQNGCDIVAIEGDAAKWRNVRKQPRLIRFLRVPELLDEQTIRTLLEQMKKIGMTRCAVVTSSGFSRSAIEYANSRPIDLFNKDQLQALLDSVDIYAALPRS